jgi:hypothetical protein
MLHPADARTVAGPRIDDNEGWLRWIDDSARRRDNAHQHIVHWLEQGAPIAHHLELEGQHVRGLGGAALEICVAALAQDVERQDRALPGVDPILLDEVPSLIDCHARLRE